MSRSNQTELPRVCQRYMEWGGEHDKGKLNYFNKETKEKVWLPLPFTFLVLDTLHTIGGFDKKNSSGYWSNEVRDIKADTLIVKSKKGKVFQGTYDGFKAFGLNGAKYVQSVYIAYKNDEGKLAIGNIQMVGSCLSAWIDFRQETPKILDVAVTITGAAEAKNGATVYKIPVFKALEVSPETNAAALALDKELQEYLTKYFGKTTNEVKEHDTTETGKEAVAEWVPNTDNMPETVPIDSHEPETFNTAGDEPYEELPF